MRDLAFIAVLVPLLGLAAARPFVGVLLWSWISFMSPHRELWGAAFNLPWAAIVFLVTLFGCAVAREPRRLQVNAPMFLLALFAVGITLTSLTALQSPDVVWSQWERTIKIIVGVLLTAALLTDRERVHALIWVIAISLGYFGIKGGIFTLITGGRFIVVGPADSIIGDRNHLATALLVSLPLMNYLRLQSRHRIVRLGLAFAMATTLFAAVGSQSRGALVALIASGFVMWTRSKGKIVSGIALVGAIAAAILFMPENWVERMHTIQTFEEDASAMGRLRTWQASWAIAVARPLTGGGFRAMYAQEIINSYMPGIVARAAHSVWFETLGEHGFLVFGIWLGIFISGAVISMRITNLTRDQPELRWAYDLARMSQVSMVAYAAGGTFLSLQYWDVMWTLIVILGATLGLVRRAARESREISVAAGWRRRAEPVPAMTQRSGIGA
jgi:putative inorganic carbon (HCO3(-)) transporter